MSRSCWRTAKRCQARHSTHAGVRRAVPGYEPARTPGIEPVGSAGCEVRGGRTVCSGQTTTGPVETPDGVPDCGVNASDRAPTTLPAVSSSCTVPFTGESPLAPLPAPDHLPTSTATWSTGCIWSTAPSAKRTRTLDTAPLTSTAAQATGMPSVAPKTPLATLKTRGALPAELHEYTDITPSPTAAAFDISTVTIPLYG